MAVMRNSATATSRKSSISRRSSAPNARASSVEIARQILRPLHIERRLTRRGCLDREQSCAAEARIEQASGDVARRGAARHEAHRTTRGAARRAPWPDAPAGTRRSLVRAVSETAPALPKPRAWVDSRLAPAPARFHQRRHTPTGGPRAGAASSDVTHAATSSARCRPCGMPADSDSVSTWRRSLGSCFHSQRRPPGMRISTSTGPA